MSQALMEQGRAGLLAWQRGDLSGLAELLDPDVELLWWEPGPWDCRGKAAVLSLLRQRLAGGQTQAGIELYDSGPDTIVVSREPTADESAQAGRPATLVTFAHGRVVRMQQYRTVQDAVAASV
jgi:ketosteroid isomerase-like protein